MAKVESPQQRLDKLCRDIMREIAVWSNIRKRGCQDPFWPDGVNMNLCRNHIIHDKAEIKRICAESGTALPDDYYLATPPEVSDDYMANMSDGTRVARLHQNGCKLNRRAPDYDTAQTALI